MIGVKRGKEGGIYKIGDTNPELLLLVGCFTHLHIVALFAFGGGLCENRNGYGKISETR